MASTKHSITPKSIDLFLVRVWNPNGFRNVGFFELLTLFRNGATSHQPQILRHDLLKGIFVIAFVKWKGFLKEQKFSALATYGVTTDSFIFSRVIKRFPSYPEFYFVCSSSSCICHSNNLGSIFQNISWQTAWNNYAQFHSKRHFQLDYQKTK